MAHMEENGNAYRILVGSLKGTRPLSFWRIFFENIWASHKLSRMYFLKQYNINTTIQYLTPSKVTTFTGMHSEQCSQHNKVYKRKKSFSRCFLTHPYDLRESVTVIQTGFKCLRMIACGLAFACTVMNFRGL